MRKQMLVRVLFIFAFCLLLALPAAVMMTSESSELEVVEKRKTVKLPELSLRKGIQSEIEEYLNDHFGFRSYLIKNMNSMKLNVFESTPDPQKVQLGKSNWLFYNSRQEGIYGSYSRRNSLNEDQLLYFEKVLNERSVSNEQRGRRYLSVIWPNKHSVYPEFLNPFMKVQITKEPSLLSQLSSAGEKQLNSFELYSVLDDLVSKKKIGQLYHKFDTHWNDLGAFYAFQAFMNKAFPNVKIPSLNTLNINKINFCKGDLLAMMAIDSSKSFCEINPVFNFQTEGIAKETISIGSSKIKAQRQLSSNASENHKVLIFGDSYCYKLMPLFGMCFREVILINGYYDDSIIEQIKPDLVISANVERNISL